MILLPQIIGGQEPTAYPVSLAEIRAQLSFDATDSDTRLAGLIAAATQQVEGWIGRALVERGYHAFLDHWPLRREGDGQGRHADMAGAPGFYGAYARALEIPMPPLVSIDAVTTYDDDDAATVFDPTNYFVDTASSLGRLVLRRGAEWPIPCRAANGIEIAWTAGAGLRPFVDEDIRAGILLAVGALNENRGDATPPDFSAAKALLSQRRLTWL